MAVRNLALWGCLLVASVQGLKMDAPLRDMVQQNVLTLFPNISEDQKQVVGDKVKEVFDHYASQFNFDTYNTQIQHMMEGASTAGQSKFYQYVDANQCDLGSGADSSSVAVLSANRVAAYPGGPSFPQFGAFIPKLMDKLMQSANGASSNIVAMQGQALALSGMQTVVGMVQSVVAIALAFIPPMIPPPIWINMPLTCLPMVTGHNCTGAVMYPISLSDFMLSSTTDQALGGTVTSFPDKYAEKVGKTSDKAYKMCFSSYMSMSCSSIFPMCTIPFAREEPGPPGRAPICFHQCIAPLILCPGFWVDDILDECSAVSAPPMCANAFFWKLGMLGPQRADYDESSGDAQAACPKASFSFEDAAFDPTLGDAVSAGSAAGSAAGGNIRLP